MKPYRFLFTSLLAPRRSQKRHYHLLNLLKFQLDTNKYQISRQLRQHLQMRLNRIRARTCIHVLQAHPSQACSKPTTNDNKHKSLRPSGCEQMRGFISLDLTRFRCQTMKTLTWALNHLLAHSTRPIVCRMSR